jgi:hypothetical protein
MGGLALGQTERLGKENGRTQVKMTSYARKCLAQWTENVPDVVGIKSRTDRTDLQKRRNAIGTSPKSGIHVKSGKAERSRHAMPLIIYYI